MGMRRSSKSERLIITYIEKNFTDSDGDLDEELEQRIHKLQSALQEAGLTIDDLAQNLDILRICTYTGFEEALEYIKKKAKAMKNKRSKIALILDTPYIIANKKEEQADQIIAILEANGLDDILGYKKENRQLLHSATPEKVKENLYYLTKLSNYKTLIRNNPELLYKYSISDLQKLIDEENAKNVVIEDAIIDTDEDIEEEKIYVNEEKTEENNDKDNSIDEENIEIITYMSKDNDQEEIKEEYENNNEETLQENESKNYEYLGEEPEILKLKEIFLSFGLPISILTNNPEICHRVTKCADVDKIRQIKSINSILKVLNRNGIPFSIIERFPEILSHGSKGKIEAIIKELGEQHLSLDLIYVCPEILLKSSPEKIFKVVKALEKAGLNISLIYSCPQILISGNVDILIDISKNIYDKAPSINVILDVSPFVFIKEIQDEYKKYDKSIDINMGKKITSSNLNILYIKNLEAAQENIEVLKGEGLNLDLIKANNQVLVSAQKDEIKGVIDKIRSYKFEDEFVEKNPVVLLSTAEDVTKITDKVKEFRPNTYTKVITDVPEIYLLTNPESIDNIFKSIEDLGIKYKVVDKEPRILLVEDTVQIGAVVNNLTQKHDVTISQIEENPRILSEGREKYIDRNYETFKLNNLDIPFGVIYTKSARNNEKNIDTLIENGLYQYIEGTPEILDVEHAKVVQYIKIAKQEEIPLIVRDSDKKKVLNVEYFKLSPDEVSIEYGIDIEEIKKAREAIDKNPPRRVKNPELYMAVLPQFFAQADKTLEEFENDEVSYKKYDQVVSKQKVVREAYIDLERASIRTYNHAYQKAKEEGASDEKASKTAKKAAKALIQIPVINKQLDKTLERLTKKIEADEEGIRKKLEEKHEKDNTSTVSPRKRTEENAKQNKNVPNNAQKQNKSKER